MTSCDVGDYRLHHSSHQRRLTSQCNLECLGVPVARIVRRNRPYYIGDVVEVPFSLSYLRCIKSNANPQALLSEDGGRPAPTSSTC